MEQLITEGKVMMTDNSKHHYMLHSTRKIINISDAGIENKTS